MPPPLLITPRVMKSGGLEPDVRLHVLDRAIYHVHSTILKLQSHFFFKFLDPPNQSDAVTTQPIPGQPKYEWVAKVDDDGEGWSLGAARDGNLESHNMNLLDKFYVKNQERGFDCFISALYGMPYQIAVAELSHICSIADYYCALPAVSRTISDAVHNEYPEDFIQDAGELAEIAIMFHHRELLSNCVIILASEQPKFSHHLFPSAEKPLRHKISRKSDAYRLVRSERAEIGRRVARISALIVQECQGNEVFRKELAEISSDYDSIPSYFRTIRNARIASGSLVTNRVLSCSLRFILGSRLDLKFGEFYGHTVAGEGKYKNYFLYSELEDHELPWDVDETDW